MKEYYLTRPIDNYYESNMLDDSGVLNLKKTKNSQSNESLFANFLNFQGTLSFEQETNCDSDSNKSLLENSLMPEEISGKNDICFSNNQQQIKISDKLKTSWKKCADIYIKFSYNNYKNILNKQSKNNKPFSDNIVKSLNKPAYSDLKSRNFINDKNKIKMEINYEQYMKYFYSEQMGYMSCENYYKNFAAKNFYTCNENNHFYSDLDINKTKYIHNRSLSWKNNNDYIIKLSSPKN